MKTLVMTCLVGVLAIPAVIYAGEKWSGDVVIDPDFAYGPFAYGGMGAARNSKDRNQKIGCFVSSNGPDHTIGYCFASDAEGRQAGCWWSDNVIYERILGSITSDSFIHFNFDANYNCTRIMVQNASAWEPKK
jgi:hypothetical protein